MDTRSTKNSLFVLCLTSVALTGCNVDPVWSEPTAKGPMVSEPSPAIAQPADGRDISIVGPGEVDLVEDALAKRNAYHSALTNLREYYSEHGYEMKESWARSELCF